VAPKATRASPEPEPARRRLFAAGCLAVASSWRAVRAQAVPAHLPPLDDLRPLLDHVRRRRVPLLVLFSTPGCRFCREVRTSYLAPRHAANGASDPIIREVDITAPTQFIDADGATTTHRDFAARFGVRVVPVVMLFGDRLHPLTEPLVGIDRAGFYEGFLGRAIDDAQRRLQR
jgi:hypothetical protein